MDEKLCFYLHGNWSKLAELLLEEIQQDSLNGDPIQLCIKVSQYGCCQVLLGNQSEAYVVYQFFKHDTQVKSSLSVREWGAVTRFLALYSLFEGDTETASTYYEQSIHAYRLIHEEEEEAMMLLESVRWLYGLLGDREKLIYIQNRIGAKYKSYFYKEPVTNPSTFREYIMHYSKREEDGHPLICQFNSLAANGKLKTEDVYLLLATADQYKHPLLKAWAHYLAGDLLRNQDYKEKAKQIFQAFNIPFEQDDSRKLTPEISFTLFNGLSVKKNGTDQIRLNHWKRKKAEELLIYMLIQPNLQIHRDVLLEELFPNDDSKKATNRLYVNISEVNKTFRKISYTEHSILFIKDGKVSLNLDLIDEIDIQSYLKLYSVGKQLWFTNRDEAVELFNKARQLFSLHFVDHLLYIHWLDQFRISLLQKQVDLLQKLYEYYDDINKKELLLQEMLDCDPLNEGTIAEMYQYLLGQGRLTEADQFYRQKRKLFQSELGVDFEMDVLK